MAASASSKSDTQVEINFEFHPPIEEDLQGIATLLKQILIPNVNLTALAEHIIKLKDVTQIIATEAPNEEKDLDEDDEPDDDIYGVISFIDLGDNIDGDNQDPKTEVRIVENSVREALMNWSSHTKELLKKVQKPEVVNKLGLIINERFINLPPQLALPSLKALTESMNPLNFTHLVFISKIMIKHMSESKKKKLKESTVSKPKASDADDDILYMNPEEEILFENCCCYSDCDVSKQSDDSAYWTLNSDSKYTSHRRIMLIEYSKWPKILDLLAEELK